MAKNARRDGFPVRHFVRNYTQNSKTKVVIKTFYLSNNCYNIKDIYSLIYSCIRDAFGEL